MINKILFVITAAYCVYSSINVAWVTSGTEYQFGGMLIATGLMSFGAGGIHRTYRCLFIEDSCDGLTDYRSHNMGLILAVIGALLI